MGAMPQWLFSEMLYSFALTNRGWNFHDLGCSRFEGCWSDNRGVVQA
jgi:hypothetical protein